MKSAILIILSVFFFVSCNKKKVNTNLIDSNSVEVAGSINTMKDSGIFHCSKCNTPLYRLENNYQSMENDESFDKAINDRVIFNENFENKTKLKCKNCGTIIGNVWDDGPISTGNRHCVSKNSLIFKKIRNDQ